MQRRSLTYQEIVFPLFAMILAATATISVQAQVLTWAKRAGGGDHDSGNSIAMLSDGGTLVAGRFRSTATFGPGESGETILSSAGDYDMFIAKYNQDGTLEWAKQAGGADYDFGNAIAVLQDGSSLLTGDFKTMATFGQGESGETVLTSAGSYDIFIAKYNADGALVWAKRAGGSDAVRGFSIAAFSDGSAFVTGWFKGTATFGSGESGETVLTSAGERDIFIAKYNPGGTLAWAKQAGGASFDVGNSIAVLSDGSVLVTGNFRDTATFGPYESYQRILTSAGSNDIFIAEYNPDGTLAWVKQAGGSELDTAYSIAALSDGSALITGWFTNSATFAPGESEQILLTSAGYKDVFIAKYNPDGTLAWVRQAGGANLEMGRSIAVLSDGSACVTGWFRYTATFGPGESGQTVLTYAGGEGDVFIAKYHPDGTLAWAKGAGGSDYDSGNSIAVLPDGSALVTGYFKGTATFGPGEAGQTVLTADSYSDMDIFIAKYSPPSEADN